MRTSRTRTAACAVAFAFVLAGCGGPAREGAVALQTADAGPGEDGADGADGTSRGGAGGDGGGAPGGGAPADPGLASATPEQLACVSRFDPSQFFPQLRAPDWHQRGAQRVWSRLQRELDQRYDEAGKSHEPIRRGLLSQDADQVNSRLVVLVAERLIDAEALERDLNSLSRRVHRTAKVRGPQLTVEVHPACFSPKEIAVARTKALAALTEHPISCGSFCAAWVLYGPEVDSRLRLELPASERAFGDELARKAGPALKVSYERGPA